MAFDINHIIAAVFESRVLFIKYDSIANPLRWVEVEVYSDFSIDGEIYIYAWDRDKNDTIRLYKLDRIEDTVLTTIFFQPRWTPFLSFI